MTDRRPASGGGSCARCHAGLGLASLKMDGVWYCSSSCGQGQPSALARGARVPEPWLTARPRRHFRQRRPKELRSATSGS